MESLVEVGAVCNVNGAWRHKPSDSRSTAEGEAQGVFMFMASICWLCAQRARGKERKILRKRQVRDEDLSRLIRSPAVLSGL